MKYLAMIQARCSSHRLPSKVLKDLNGKTVLERVVERVQKARLVDEVMVVTSLNYEDLAIVKLMAQKGIRVFAGSLEDVLDRYYQAAKIVMPEYIIRITADCPLIDHGVIDEALENMRPDVDYLGMLTETFPDGLDVEVIKFSALKTSWKEATLKSEREHVTLYVKNHQDLFNVQNFECGIGNLHDQRWTLDEAEDYDFVKNVYDYFLKEEKDDFNMQDILAYLKTHPEVEAINRGFIRNEGLLISRQNESIVKNEDLI